MTEEVKPSKVRRWRRALYAFVVSGASIGSAVYLGQLQTPSTATETAIRGLLEVPVWVTILYIGGSVADSTTWGSALVDRVKNIAGRSS